MIKEIAYAKINLALDVVGKRPDGYHDLKMLMIPITLHDVLTFEKANSITLESNVQIEHNAILKTAYKMKEDYQVSLGASITLTKNIPIGGGLAGGSADIAATIRGLNQLWELNLPLTEMETLALSLGSDTLFCLHNKPAYVSGRGENISFIKTPPISAIYIFPSPLNVSTKEVFEHHQISYHPHRFDRLLQRYSQEKYSSFFKKTYNALTKTTLACYPELNAQFKNIQKIGHHAIMSGSGSTFYILSFQENDQKLIDKTIKYGIQFIKSYPKT
jgi:4-diphosphocytidyl-2-C-methyl-D-erythritol kinase